MFLKNTFEKSWVISSRSSNYLFLSKFFHKNLEIFENIRVIYKYNLYFKPILA